jgi:hypothetical protein
VFQLQLFERCPNLPDRSVNHRRKIICVQRTNNGK